MCETEKNQKCDYEKLSETWDITDFEDEGKGP